jgi:phage tail sheath protein FI
MSAQTLYPGVYVIESPVGAPTITGVSTSVTAFVGYAGRGPLDKAMLVLNSGDFERLYGGMLPETELACAVSQYFNNGGSEAWIVRVAARDTGQPPAGEADVIGSPSEKTGLYALDAVDVVNILCLPDIATLDGATASRVIATAARYCERRMAFFIVDLPRTVASVAEASDWVQSLGAAASANAAAYFPRLKVASAAAPGELRDISPSGAIAGLYAATDSRRGVWKAPAGVDAALRGVSGLTAQLTDAENGVLNPLGLNVLRSFPACGVVAWGARTLMGADTRASEWKYISVRRLALHIEDSLKRGLQWTVFVPNGEVLWSQIRLSVSSFMQGLFTQGAFAGMAPNQAWFVRCDGSTTPPADVESGVVNIQVGFAPLRPEEFLVIDIQQIAGCPAS